MRDTKVRARLTSRVYAVLSLGGRSLFGAAGSECVPLPGLLGALLPCPLVAWAWPSGTAPLPFRLPRPFCASAHSVPSPAVWQALVKEVSSYGFLMQAADAELV